MTIYVDPLLPRGWVLRGRHTLSCHLFTDELDLKHLHRLAMAIGCQQAWFQDALAAPHYDLTPARRLAAIDAGAVAVPTRRAVEIWKARRQALQGASTRR